MCKMIVKDMLDLDMSHEVTPEIAGALGGAGPLGHPVDVERLAYFGTVCTADADDSAT